MERRFLLVILLASRRCTGVPHRGDVIPAATAPKKCTKCNDEQHQHLPPPDPDVVGDGPRTVSFRADLPVSGVIITGNPIFLSPMESNIDYLLTSFDVDHLLLPFRVRAGKAHNASGSRPQVAFWDSDLKGSNAGRFLMGAGNTLRWLNNSALRKMLDTVVDGIAECKNESGYILAYDPPGFMHSEQGDYGRSWFTQGMIEAGKAGNANAFPLLRGMYDWFNSPDRNPYLPYLYDGISNGEQGQIASTRMYLETPGAKWADSQTAQDAYRDNVWMRGLIARDPRSITKYHMPSPNHPHCYEITSFLSMFDNYRATGNTTWLAAAEGAWEMVSLYFTHIDGTSALTEGAANRSAGTDWQAKTYKLAGGTGETCCTTFWIKFNQRFQLLRPDEEKYAGHIETAVYNALLRTMVPRSALIDSKQQSTAPTEEDRREQIAHGKGYVAEQESWLVAQLEADADPALPPGIRYHSPLEGTLEHGNNVNTCCEGQGTRMFGAIPELIYSISTNRSNANSTVSSGFYVNLITESTLRFNASARPLSDPVQAQPAPAAIVEPVEPAPQMTFKLVSPDGGGYFTGESTCVSQGNCPGKNVTTLDECKALCLSLSTDAGNSFESCMGISWTTAPAGPLPPSPPPSPWVPRSANPCVLYNQIEKTANGTPSTIFVGAWGYVKCKNGTSAPGCATFGAATPCAGANCVMLPLAKQNSHTGAVFSGKFAITPTSSAIKDIHSCNVLCLETENCVQTTWATNAIAPAKIPSPPPLGCEIYHSIDMERPADNNCGRAKCGPFQDNNTQQYIVIGRRIVTQYDFVAPSKTETIARARDDVFTPIEFSQQTDFPYGDGTVKMKLSILNNSIEKVAVRLRLRIPSWAAGSTGRGLQRLPVELNGNALSGDDIGVPGTYTSIDREWSNGDTISLVLSPTLELVPYTGVDQIKGYEDKRYAVTVGPAVLACVALGHNKGSLLPVLIPASPTAPVSTWLTIDPEYTSGYRRSYSIKGVTGFKMVPLWEVPAATVFTTYPVLTMD